MKLRLLHAALLAMSLVLAPSPGAADELQDAIISQLARQGFTHVKISTTFLGRVRIYATSPEHRREIIYNPRTGEILRDYWRELDGGFGQSSSSGGRPLVTPGGSHGDGDHGDDDHGDDDGWDDDDWDDDEEDDEDEEDEEDDEDDDDGDDGGEDDD